MSLKIGTLHFIHSCEKKAQAIKRFVLLELATKEFSWYNSIYKNLKDKIYKKGKNKPQKIKIYQTVIWDAIKKLEREGDVYVEKENQKIGGKGQPVRIIRITKRGLFKLLAHDDAWAFIDKIASNHKDKLPIIFGYWDHFVKEGVKSKVIEAMRIFFKNPLPYFSREFSKMKKEVQEKYFAVFDSMLDDMLNHYVLFLPLLSSKTPNEAREWLKVWQEKTILKRYMIEEFQRKMQQNSEIKAYVDMLRENDAKNDLVRKRTAK